MKRIERHHKLATALAFLSDRNLLKQLNSGANNDGWGTHQVIDIAGHPVFVKRVPVTDLEAENAYSTRNLYRLPSWYNYGVGSHGINAFRELAALVKATHWVLGGECNAFPLLHHHRILPYENTFVASAEHERQFAEYVRYWNNSRTVERFVRERSAATHQLVFFIEWFPHVFKPWLSGNPGKLERMFPQAVETIGFLQANGVIHFDAHADNWVTDGRHLYLADFGLALDRDFELTATEHRFFEGHRYYDSAQIVLTATDVPFQRYRALGPADREKVNLAIGVTPDDPYRFRYLLASHATALDAQKLIRLPPVVKRFFARYQPIMDLKGQFLLELRTNKKTAYPHEALTRRLKTAGLIGER